MATISPKAAALALLMIAPPPPAPPSASPEAPAPPATPGPNRVVVVNQDGVATFDSDSDDPVVIHSEHVRKRGFIGVRLMDLTPDLRTHFGAPRDAGVMVSEIDKDSPAAKAGLAVGDIVTGADGERVASSGDLSRLVRRKKAGEALRLDVSRDRAAKHLSVAVEERDAPWIDIGDMGQLDHFRHLGPEIRAEVMRDLERNPPRIEMRRDRLEKKIDEMQKRIDELEKRLPKSAQ